MPAPNAGGQSSVSPVFYPSMVALLNVRLDELFQPEQDMMPTATAIDDLVQTLSTLPTSAVKSTKPSSTSGANDKLSFVVKVVPKSASVELPSYRQAGKFTMVVDFRDIPIDPRQIRAIGVEIHLGTVSGQNFAQGITSTPGPYGRSSILPLRTPDGGVTDTLLMQGTVDVISWEHDDKISQITLEGRDLRGILLDSPIRPGQLHALDLSQPIGPNSGLANSATALTDVVSQILKQHPLMNALTIKTIPSEWPNATLPSPGVKGDYTRVRLGAAGIQAGNPAGSSSPTLTGPGDPQKLNFWDMIIQYCYLCGAVPYFVGEVLWIRRARNLFDVLERDVPTTADPTATTPFRGPRLDASGRQLKVRRIVYGGSMLKYKLERRISGVTTPAVELVCENTSGSGRGWKNKLLISQFYGATEKDGTPILYHPLEPGYVPPSKRKASGRAARVARTRVSPSGAASMTEVLRIPVHGVASLARLDDMAIAIWKEIGHQETGGSFSTKSLASFGGGNDDTDLVRLRPGDPVEVTIRSDALLNSSPVNAELIAKQRLAPAGLAKAFQDRRSLDSTAAQAASLTGKGGASLPDTHRFFRVGNVKYAWGMDGVSIDADFSNFVELRFQDDGKSTDQIPSAPQVGAAAASVPGSTNLQGRRSGP